MAIRFRRLPETKSLSNPKATASVIPLPAQSYVYVIGDANGPQKVGFAADPKRRLALFRTGNIGDLRIALAAPVSRDLARHAERFAHWLLRDHHARGEWFSVSPEMAMAAVEQAIVAVLNGQRAPLLPIHTPPGKPKIFHGAMHVRLPKDTKARIDALRGSMRQGDYVRILLLDAIKRAEDERAAVKRETKPG